MLAKSCEKYNNHHSLRATCHQVWDQGSTSSHFSNLPLSPFPFSTISCILFGLISLSILFTYGPQSSSNTLPCPTYSSLIPESQMESGGFWWILVEWPLYSRKSGGVWGNPLEFWSQSGLSLENQKSGNVKSKGIHRNSGLSLVSVWKI